MVKKAVALVLSTLALSSAQLINVPPRRIRGNDMVMQSSKYKDSAFGRKSSNLRSNNKQQHRRLSMSVNLSAIEHDESVQLAPPLPEKHESVVAATEGDVPPAKAENPICSNSAECTEDTLCQCRFNCLFCSDTSMLQLSAFCGKCV